MTLSLLTKLVSEEAYRHGTGYAENRVLRSVGKYQFKNPIVCSSYPVEQFSMEVHRFLESVYKHAFRAGLKQGGRNE